MEFDQCQKSIVICGTLHCALWSITLCFTVHCIVLCGTLYCAFWSIALCFVAHYIVLCGTLLLCALWSTSLCFVVVELHRLSDTSHCAYDRSRLYCTMKYIAQCTMYKAWCEMQNENECQTVPFSKAHQH